LIIKEFVKLFRHQKYKNNINQNYQTNQSNYA